MKKNTLEIKWAFVLTLTQLLWIACEKQAGLYTVHIEDYPIYTNLFFFPALVVYLLALHDFRKKQGNETLSYKQGLFTGLRIMYISTMLSPITITFRFIFFDLLSNLNSFFFDKTGVLPVDSGSNSSFLWILITGFIATPVIGFILSAIIPLFFREKKKNRPNLELLGKDNN
jgi:uncharacterized membrane protein